jgi:hypothetical protein
VKAGAGAGADGSEAGFGWDARGGLGDDGPAAASFSWAAWSGARRRRRRRRRSCHGFLRGLSIGTATLKLGTWVRLRVPLTEMWGPICQGEGGQAIAQLQLPIVSQLKVAIDNSLL